MNKDVREKGTRNIGNLDLLFLFNWPSFPQSFQVGLEFAEIFTHDPACHPTNSMKL